jgi:hypothetical protein
MLLTLDKLEEEGWTIEKINGSAEHIKMEEKTIIQKSTWSNAFHAKHLKSWGLKRASSQRGRMIKSIIIIPSLISNEWFLSCCLTIDVGTSNNDLCQFQCRKYLWTTDTENTMRY